MSWVRSDDNEPNHPKIFRAGIAAYGFFQAAKCYCSRYLTDGFIPVGDLSLIFPGVPFKTAMKLTIKLVECGLFDKQEAPPGWRVHDYLDYNLSREEVMQKRDERAASGRRGGLAKARGHAKQELDGSQPTVSAPALPYPALPDPKKQRPPHKPPRGGNTDEPPGWLEFWRVYPKKIGRGDALRVWHKLNCEPIADEIVTAVVKQTSWMLREGGQFVPNPATYLNQTRWKDEPPAVNNGNFSTKTSGNAAAAEEAIRFMRERTREHT